MRKIKAVATMVLSLSMILGMTVPAKAAEGVATKEVTTAKKPKIKAKAAIAIDAKSGKYLYTKNIDKKLYPASITKILTTLVAIEHNKDLTKKITFSDAAVNHLEQGSTIVGIQEGEQVSLYDALEAIMLESANEACNGVAEYTAGSIDKFVDMMNEKAKELGCTNSHFVTTNGLHNKNHYVTARDMAKITKAALKNDTFREIACKSNYKMKSTNKEEARELWNHHKMVKKTMFLYDGVEGGKTGYTTKASGTLVTFAKRGEQEIITVTLRGNLYDLYKDTISLMNYGFNNYKTIEPFAGIKGNLEITDECAILKTGNQLSPCTLSVENLHDRTVMLRKDQDPAKVKYRFNKDKCYVTYDGTSLGYINL